MGYGSENNPATKSTQVLLEKKINIITSIQQTKKQVEK